MLNKPPPFPSNKDADILPLIFTLPVNSEPLSADFTTNPKFGDTDAVTEPDLISVEICASSVRAERGMLNNLSPLPLNEPENNSIPAPFTNKLPLTSIEPVNSEPLSIDCTLNPKFGDTDAVTEPDAILG